MAELGPVSGMAVTNTYSNRLRVALQASGGWTNGFAYTYDKIGQLKSAYVSGGATADQWRYGYDAGWNMTRRTNGVSLAGVTT